MRSHGIWRRPSLPLNTPMVQTVRDRMTPEQLTANDAENQHEIPLGENYGDPDKDAVRS
ncbi:hypothetical protein ACFSCZ_00220 [Siminovitchia sediminis]|uniref:Uncharacterized protein n=1 Tax=Siminovitchia sediminis TaxID=1274353 RepID=A0ABW4KD05_9BACI